jgi:dolichol-phosphate mannosyltransferase
MISIIIPTYNERENIEELIKRIFKISKNLSLEVIVVDDNSQDGTAEIVKLLSKKYKLKLLKRPKKLGLISAIIDGLRLAKGNIIGVMDADFAHPPEKIPEFIEAMKNYDIVVGSRYKVKNRSIFRSTISWGATIIAKLFFGLKIKDPLSGFFFCKRKILEKTKINAVGFKILLNILVKNRNKKIKEIPYISIERKKGKSKLYFEEVINYIKTVFRLKMVN